MCVCVCIYSPTHIYTHIVHVRASSTILPHVRVLELAQRFARWERRVGRWRRPLRARLAAQRGALRIEACKVGRPVGQAGAQHHSLMHVLSPNHSAEVSAVCEEGTIRMARPPAVPSTSYSQPASPLAGHDRICAAAHAASGAKRAGGGPVPPACRHQSVVHVRSGGNAAAVGAPTPPLDFG